MGAPPVSQWRRELTVERIRALGVPRSVISDFEIEAALIRDRQWTEQTASSVDQYDRRGLLNIIATLVARG